LAPPPPIAITNPKGAGNSTLPVMQNADVRWNGQIVAVVLAETQEQADAAASLVIVRYEPSSARTDFDAAKAHAHTPDSMMLEKNRLSVGDAGKALANAAVSIDAVYRTPWHWHNPIELHAATVRWDGDRLTVYDASQMIHAAASTLATVFGLDRSQVRVISPFVGGGFGAKSLWNHQILAIAAAKLAKRPVRIMMTRAGVYRAVGGRSPTEQRVALGTDATGHLQAIIHTGYSVKPDHSVCDEAWSLTARSLYRSKTFDIVQHAVELDSVANTFMRAPGEAPGSFAIECAMDELAHAAGIDPIELRRLNEPQRDPTRGSEFSQRGLLKAYELGAARFGWNKRSATPTFRRDGEWLVGMGCATGAFPYARMPGMSVKLILTAQGKATILSAAHEMGMGTTTAQRQHTADRLGLDVEDVAVQIGDSDLPFATMAGGSSQTASMASAIMVASEKLAAELLRLAGNDTPLAGLRPRDVALVNGGIAKADEPNRFESYASILKRAGRKEISVVGESPAPLELLKFSMYSHSAIFAEVLVSEVTGEVRVSRLLGSFDCGRILNPTTATSQFKGGMIMGLGMALYEEALFDARSGRIMNASLSDYHVPVHLDVPDIAVIWTDIPDPRAPLGARGIGEIGITGVAASIANAVFNATGKRVRDLPITLDKLL
jgi:xanthine dehydrogenase YagR molybdenum-binding subunit